MSDSENAWVEMTDDEIATAAARTNYLRKQGIVDPPQAASPARPSASSQSSLYRRYTNAYLVARTINGLGEGIKIVGLVLGGLIALAGFAAASKLGGALGFASFLLGVIIALPLYVLGVLVSAQGQILKATLDTAVNSSPLLSHDEIRHILTL